MKTHGNVYDRMDQRERMTINGRPDDRLRDPSGACRVWRLSRPGLAVVVFAAMWIGGCASLTPERFAAARPLFDPQAYFTGPVHSSGVFENRAGAPAKRFTTTSIGRRQGDTLLLDQEFTYEDGTRQQRHWRIRRVDAHRFDATAKDVVGTATGEAYGNAFRWQYTVALKPGNPLLDVRLTQWMYLEPDGLTMVNRATIKKLGIEVAQVTEYFRRG